MRSALLCAVLVAGVTACAGSPSVPDVVGLSADGARRQLEDEEFRVNEETTEADAPEGEVVAQSPEPGEALENEGDRATISVAIPVTEDITGTITLTDGSHGDIGSSCSGSGGYDDMRQAHRSV